MTKKSLELSVIGLTLLNLVATGMEYMEALPFCIAKGLTLYTTILMILSILAGVVSVYCYSKYYEASSLVDIEIKAVSAIVTIAYVAIVQGVNYFYYKLTLYTLISNQTMPVLQPLPTILNAMAFMIYVLCMYRYEKEVNECHERKLKYMERNHYYNVLVNELTSILQACKDEKCRKEALDLKEKVDCCFDVRNQNQSEEVLVHLRNAQSHIEDNSSQDQVLEEIQKAHKQWDMR